MKYQLYKLSFSTPVHFGKNLLNSSEYTLCSDTIFSALCSEVAREGEEAVDRLVSLFRENKLVISDAFPYINDKFFLPKPYMRIEREENDDSSVVRKAYKKLNYIDADQFDSYLNGKFDIMSAASMSELGKSSVKISAAVRSDKEETLPYEVGLFAFYANCGLYLIVGYDSDDAEALFDMVIEQLGLSGIGGKCSSGYGRFSCEKIAATDWLVNRLADTNGTKMLLNTALPKADELDRIVGDARYSLIKRSGFVTSTSYSDTWQRKNDIYMFKSGSCFSEQFEGDIYDVSNGVGKHPVYRYGKPLMMRVSL